MSNKKLALSSALLLATIGVTFAPFVDPRDSSSSAAQVTSSRGNQVASSLRGNQVTSLRGTRGTQVATPAATGSVLSLEIQKLKDEAAAAADKFDAAVAAEKAKAAAPAAGPLAPPPAPALDAETKKLKDDVDALKKILADATARFIASSKREIEATKQAEQAAQAAQVKITDAKAELQNIIGALPAAIPMPAGGEELDLLDAFYGVINATGPAPTMPESINAFLTLINNTNALIANKIRVGVAAAASRAAGRADIDADIDAAVAAAPADPVAIAELRAMLATANDIANRLIRREAAADIDAAVSADLVSADFRRALAALAPARTLRDAVDAAEAELVAIRDAITLQTKTEVFTVIIERLQQFNLFETAINEIERVSNNLNVPAVAP